MGSSGSSLPQRGSSVTTMSAMPLARTSWDRKLGAALWSYTGARGERSEVVEGA